MNITKAVNAIRAVSAVLSEKDKSPMIKWIEINTDSKREYKEYSIPKKIWIYWDSITPLVLLIYAYIKHLKYALITR